MTTLTPEQWLERRRVVLERLAVLQQLEFSSVTPRGSSCYGMLPEPCLEPD
jgi:hypothetical protein